MYLQVVVIHTDGTRDEPIKAKDTDEVNEIIGSLPEGWKVEWGQVAE